MLFLWFVLILAVKEKWLSMCNRNLHDCIHISIPVPLRLGHICNRKKVNYRDEYGPEIPTNLQSLHFHGNEKTIKLAKKVNDKDRRKRKRNCKTLCKVNCIQISYKKCLILDVPTIERSVLGGNVCWDLKLMSTIGNGQL